MTATVFVSIWRPQLSLLERSSAVKILTSVNPPSFFILTSEPEVMKNDGGLRPVGGAEVTCDVYCGASSNAVEIQPRP